jgi:hypothetical protein
MTKQMALFNAPTSRGPKIYFATDGQFIKIGRTTSSEISRMKSLSTGNARPLTILAVCPGMSESVIHKRFNKYRVRGEWFTMHPELTGFIEGLQAYLYAAASLSRPAALSPAPSDTPSTEQIRSPWP